MFFKSVWLVVQAECVLLCLLPHLLKNVQEKTPFSVKKNDYFSVVRAHRVHRMGEDYVGPRAKGDLCVLFNVRMPQDLQRLHGMC